MKGSNAEEQFALLLKDHGIPFEQEYRFRGLNDQRRWRFDFVVLPLYLQIAIEIEGGSYVYGRHNRPKGFAADCEKYNQATLMGWKVLRYTPNQALELAPLEIVHLINNVRSNDFRSYPKATTAICSGDISAAEVRME